MQQMMKIDYELLKEVEQLCYLNNYSSTNLEQMLQPTNMESMKWDKMNFTKQYPRITSMLNIDPNDATPFNDNYSLEHLIILFIGQFLLAKEKNEALENRIITLEGNYTHLKDKLAEKGIHIDCYSTIDLTNINNNVNLLNSNAVNIEARITALEKTYVEENERLTKENTQLKEAALL